MHQILLRANMTLGFSPPGAGLYLMEIPRQVDHIFLSNGNRGELLVKCTGTPGQRYVLAAGAEPSPFGANFSTSGGGLESLVQPVVVTIEIEATEVGCCMLSSLPSVIGLCSAVEGPPALGLQPSCLRLAGLAPNLRAACRAYMRHTVCHLPAAVQAELPPLSIASIAGS